PGEAGRGVGNDRDVGVVALVTAAAVCDVGKCGHGFLPPLSPEGRGEKLGVNRATNPVPRRYSWPAAPASRRTPRAPLAGRSGNPSRPAAPPSPAARTPW